MHALFYHWVFYQELGPEKQSKIGTTLSKTVQDCLVCLGSVICQNCGGTGNRWPYLGPDLRASSVNDNWVQLILDCT